MNQFEDFFTEFVRWFGGEKLLESTDRNVKRADYLFRSANVIAELKTLEEDKTSRHDAKVGKLFARWQQQRRIIVYGRVNVGLHDIASPLQREWMDVLKRLAQDCVRDGNDQIRQTKVGLEMPDAKGLLVVANTGNPLFADPQDFLKVASALLRKQAATGEPCFPHIHGVACVGITPMGPVWSIGYFKEEMGLAQFQEKLSSAWSSYVTPYFRQPPPSNDTPEFDQREEAQRISPERNSGSH